MGHLALNELLQNPHSFNCTSRTKFFPLLKKQQHHVLYNARTNRLSIYRGTLTFAWSKSGKNVNHSFIIGAL